MMGAVLDKQNASFCYTGRHDPESGAGEHWRGLRCERFKVCSDTWKDSPYTADPTRALEVSCVGESTAGMNARRAEPTQFRNQTHEWSPLEFGHVAQMSHIELHCLQRVLCIQDRDRDHQHEIQQPTEIDMCWWGLVSLVLSFSTSTLKQKCWSSRPFHRLLRAPKYVTLLTDPANLP
jgi:hypothetical protein